jgi:HAD superfamily hydrolase (TIGR01549 family)
VGIGRLLDRRLYPDAVDCLERLRADGLFVGIAGNQTAALEEWARSSELPVDVVTGSSSLGVRKPDPAFFERLVELAGAPASEVAYVGDRADNDARPALAAGLVLRPPSPRPVGAGSRPPRRERSRSSRSRSSRAR